MDRNKAKATLLQVLSEILTEGIENGPTETYSKADIDRAARGLAYLVAEGCEPSVDPWYLDNDPWAPTELATPFEPVRDSYTQSGLFLDLGDTRYTLGTDGFTIIDDDGRCTRVDPEHLPALARMFRQAADIGYVDSI